MLQPLAWHRSCLVNSTRTANNLREQIKALQEQLNRLDDSNRFYSIQIKEAEIAGRTGFDVDKFMRKHRDKK